MKLDGYQVKGMGSAIQELIMEDGIPVMPEEQEDMFVLTNREMWYGAAGMLLDAEFLSMKFGRRNFYILPSSVHEVLLVPDRGKYHTEELNRMVWEVNRSEVLEEERLADHVYYYDWEKGGLQIAGNVSF